MIREESDKIIDDSNFHQNLKISKISNNENEIVTATPIIISRINRVHFFFNSKEAYIILAISKGKIDYMIYLSFLIIFGESFKVFKDKDQMFVLIIWNGKITYSFVKFTILMNSFDLNKKFLI